MSFIGILSWVLFAAVLLAALPLQILGFPGSWMVFADAFSLRLLAGPDRIGISTVIVLALMAFLGEGMEFKAATAGAGSVEGVKGAAAASIVGAIAGGILGAPLFFGLGAIPGMATGAWVAVFMTALLGGHEPGRAYKAAFGALMGRLKGTAVKMVICTAMIAIVIASLLW